jgi:hypothetical protein
VTGDGTCVHHFTPHTKTGWNALRTSKCSESQKNSVCQCALKGMAPVTWDTKGIIHFEFVPRGTTHNVHAHCDTLRRMHEAFSRKRYRRLLEGALLQLDRVTPRSSCRTRVAARRFAGNFWTIHPIVLKMPCRTSICLGI